MDIFSLFEDPADESQGGLTVSEGLEIKDGCLYGCRPVPEILVVPESVKSIAAFAFKGCDELKEVYFPKSLEVIEHDAFRDCQNLMAIHFPEDANLCTIGDCAFKSCLALGDLTLPKSLDCIGKFAFCEAGQLAVAMPSVVYKMNSQWLAEGCSDFSRRHGLGNIHLHSNLAVEAGAFDRARIDEVLISVNSLGEGVFANAMINTVIWDCNLREIPQDTFAYSSLIRFEFADIDSTPLNKIGSSAFSNCRNLLSFEFPKSLTEIGDNAFSAAALRKVVAPPNLKRIGCAAFAYCECTEIDLHNVEVLKSVGLNAFRSTGIRELYLNTSQAYLSDNIVDDCMSLILLELGKDVKHIYFSVRAVYTPNRRSLTLVHNSEINICGTPKTTQLMLPAAGEINLDTSGWSKQVYTEEELKELDYYADDSKDKIIVTYF